MVPVSDPPDGLWWLFHPKSAQQEANTMARRNPLPAEQGQAHSGDPPADAAARQFN